MDSSQQSPAPSSRLRKNSLNAVKCLFYQAVKNYSTRDFNFTSINPSSGDSQQPPKLLPILESFTDAVLSRYFIRLPAVSNLSVLSRVSICYIVRFAVPSVVFFSTANIPSFVFSSSLLFWLNSIHSWSIMFQAQSCLFYFTVVSHGLSMTINSFATSCYRIMLSVKLLDKISNELIYSCVNQTELVNAEYKLKLKWLGRTLIREENVINHTLTLYEPVPRHGRVRPGQSQWTYLQHSSSISDISAFGADREQNLCNCCCCCSMMSK